MKSTTFEMNGKKYKTDEETLSVLRGIVPAAKCSGDGNAVAAGMMLGLETGRIREVRQGASGDRRRS